MRKMGEASTITQIVVTIGLLATLIGIGNVLWPAGSATKPYTLPSFFGDARVHIGGVAIPWHSLVVLACATSSRAGAAAPAARHPPRRRRCAPSSTTAS